MRELDAGQGGIEGFTQEITRRTLASFRTWRTVGTDAIVT